MAQLGDKLKYEWDVEEVDSDEDCPDVMEHYFQASAKECVEFIKKPPPAERRWNVVLVLDDQDSRSWAYVDMDTMKLPEYFENAEGRNTRRVPVRFHDELAKAVRQ
jgi:hypothetical protein